ncbi:phage holin family protein [Nocardioides aurantiacus]|uniref:phage holin family protein n=1 Tax=Nocardioides aurantiacus TaxID=86796 RepID=UPI00403EF70E
MTDQSGSTAVPTSPTHDPRQGADPTLGALVNQLTTQVPDLIRSEMRLAQAELAQKGKRVGVGIGMFSAAGLLAFFGFGTLVATAVLALALVLDGWLAALIVAVVLFVIAGILAFTGKGQVQQATPLAPEKAQQGVKDDIATVKGQRA